jgi:hypothetical protein
VDYAKRQRFGKDLGGRDWVCFKVLLWDFSEGTKERN